MIKSWKLITQAFSQQTKINQLLNEHKKLSQLNYEQPILKQQGHVLDDLQRRCLLFWISVEQQSPMNNQVSQEECQIIERINSIVNEILLEKIESQSDQSIIENIVGSLPILPLIDFDKVLRRQSLEFALKILNKSDSTMFNIQILEEQFLHAQKDQAQAQTTKYLIDFMCSTNSISTSILDEIDNFFKGYHHDINLYSSTLRLLGSLPYECPIPKQMEKYIKKWCNHQFKRIQLNDQIEMACLYHFIFHPANMDILLQSKIRDMLQRSTSNPHYSSIQQFVNSSFYNEQGQRFYVNNQQNDGQFRQDIKKYFTKDELQNIHEGVFINTFNLKNNVIIDLQLERDKVEVWRKSQSNIKYPCRQQTLKSQFHSHLKYQQLFDSKWYQWKSKPFLDDKIKLLKQGWKIDQIDSLY